MGQRTLISRKRFVVFRKRTKETILDSRRILKIRYDQKIFPKAMYKNFKKWPCQKFADCKAHRKDTKLAKMVEIGRNSVERPLDWPKMVENLAEIELFWAFSQFLRKITILCKVGIYEATYNNIILITAWLW